MSQVLEIVRNHTFFIYDISIERNYKTHTSQLTLKIQVKQREPLEALFDEIRLLEAVTGINLVVLF